MTAREEFVKAMQAQVEKTKQLINVMDEAYCEDDDEKQALKNLRALAVVFHTQNRFRCDPKKCAHAIVFLRDCGLEERDDD